MTETDELRQAITAALRVRPDERLEHLDRAYAVLSEDFPAVERIEEELRAAALCDMEGRIHTAEQHLHAAYHFIDHPDDAEP